MANRVLTQNILRELKRHQKQETQVLEGMSGAMNDGAMKWDDICLATVLEHDFGPSWRQRIKNADDNAMEAVMTSGTFNKMMTRMVRHALMENPREEYKLSGLVTSETIPECEGNFRDWGVFSDIEVHEVCELEAGPLYGIATDYQDHPQGKQYAAGLAWTREAMCADPNRYLMKQVPKLRDAHLLKKEELLLDAFIGYVASYDRSGTLYDTYYEEDGADTPYDDDGPWINASGDCLTCGSDILNVTSFFEDMVDLVHGRPVITNTDSMTVITSVNKAKSIRPILMSSEVRCDQPCDQDETTCTYIMTGDVARGGTSVTVVPYRRFVDKLMARFDLTRAEAEEWMWFGDDINAFLGWVWQIAPEITRCPISGDDCRKRIVANYASLSKGYAYIKDPMRGLMLPCAGSASV